MLVINTILLVDILKAVCMVVFLLDRQKTCRIAISDLFKLMLLKVYVT